MNAQVLSKLENKFGAVVFNGVKYWQTQDPYLSGTNEEPYCEAAAIDKSGADCVIYWNALPGVNLTNVEDLGDACDWDNPADVRKL